MKIVITKNGSVILTTDNPRGKAAIGEEMQKAEISLSLTFAELENYDADVILGKVLEELFDKGFLKV